MIRLGLMLAAAVAMSIAGSLAHAKMAMQTFAVLAGAGAHDVYPAPDGAVWFTAQSAGKLGRLDPRTGKSDLITLGPGAAPHGVIVGPDGAAWVTEGGQNAIARVDPATRAVKLFPLPKERRNANLNTATFDRQGVLWFTGQNGVYGRLDPKSGTRRHRPVRHRYHAGWPGVLRLARRQLPWSDRSRDRHRHRPGASSAAPRRPTRLE